jgi:ankyrin repeat protein
MKGGNEKIVAAAWVWRGYNDYLEFDSIESHINFYNDIAKETMILDFYLYLGKRLVKQHHVPLVMLGDSQNMPKMLGLPNVTTFAYPINYDGYRDSKKEQRLLAHPSFPLIKLYREKYPASALRPTQSTVLNVADSKAWCDLAIVNKKTWRAMTPSHVVLALCPDEMDKRVNMTYEWWSIIRAAKSIIPLDMIKQYADQVNIYLPDHNGKNILDFALSNKQWDIILLLIQNEVDYKKIIKILFKAFKHKELYIIEQLFEFNKELCYAIYDSNTTLHAAIKADSSKIAIWLIDQGVNIQKENTYGETALHYAADVGSLENINILIKHNIDLNKTDSNGKTALHIALQQGFSDIAKLLISKGADIHKIDAHHNTTLHIAVKKGLVDIVELLIEQGVDIHKEARYNETALHYAAFTGSLEIIHLLIQHNIDINKENAIKETALHIALKNGQADIAKILIDRGANIQNETEHKQTTLHCAVSTGLLEIANFLIKQNIDINKADRNGMTALHIALDEGCDDIAKLLIDQGADIHKVCYLNNTTLHLAAKKGCVDIAEFLFHQGVDIHKVNYYKDTALHCAASAGSLKIVNLLIKQHIDINMVNADGKTALHIALDKGWGDIAKFLIDQGADIHKVDNLNNSTLHLAAKSGLRDIVEILINKSVDIHKVNSDQETALHHAASAGSLEIVNFLIKQNIDINKSDSHGNTALHHAVTSTRLNVVKYLLQQGLNIQMENTRKYTALDLILSEIFCPIEQLVEIAFYLLNCGACTNDPTRQNTIKKHRPALIFLFKQKEYFNDCEQVIIKYIKTGKLPCYLNKEDLLERLAESSEAEKIALNASMQTLLLPQATFICGTGSIASIGTLFAQSEETNHQTEQAQRMEECFKLLNLSIMRMDNVL